MAIRFLVKQSASPVYGYTDSSPYNRTVTENGTIVWDTSSKEFGLSSLYLGGAGNLSTAFNTNLNLGTSFTISLWINYAAAALAGQSRVLMYYSYDESEGGLKPGGYTIDLIGTGTSYADGTLSFSYWPDEGASAVAYFAPAEMQSWPIAGSGWTHIAFVRDLGNFYVFIDGVSRGTNVGTGSSSAIHGTVTDDFRLGRSSIADAQYFIGGIDELLIVDGSAIWTSGFTPPTTPWADPGPAGTKLLMHMDNNV